MRGRDPKEVLAGIRDRLADECRRADERARLADQRAEAARRDAALFRAVVGDAVPLAPAGRVAADAVRPPPLPVQRLRDERAALESSLSDGIDGDALIDADADLTFARAGIGTDTVRRLRRGDWAVQAHLDLHGMTRDQAREAVGAFLAEARSRGHRCLRIVHGKGLGSANRAPVLKSLVRRWLTQCLEVLAFAQARGNDGGAGAVLVLLRRAVDTSLRRSRPTLTPMLSESRANEP